MRSENGLPTQKPDVLTTELKKEAVAAELLKREPFPQKDMISLTAYAVAAKKARARAWNSILTVTERVRSEEEEHVRMRI